MLSKYGSLILRRRWDMNRLSEGYKQAVGPLTKIGVVWQRSYILAKNRDFGRPQKNSLFCPNHGLAMPRKSCSKKNIPFSKINISLYRNFACFFGIKPTFGQKKNFSPERKNGRFSVILARTWLVVILGHFSMAQTVPPSFLDDGKKLRILIKEK